MVECVNSFAYMQMGHTCTHTHKWSHTRKPGLDLLCLSVLCVCVCVCVFNMCHGCLCIWAVLYITSGFVSPQMRLFLSPLCVNYSPFFLPVREILGELRVWDTGWCILNRLWSPLTQIYNVCFWTIKKYKKGKNWRKIDEVPKLPKININISGWMWWK